MMANNQWRTTNEQASQSDGLSTVQPQHPTVKSERRKETDLMREDTKAILEAAFGGDIYCLH